MGLHTAPSCPELQLHWSQARVRLLTAVPLRGAEEGLWLPNTERPAWLDGSLPGDRGFDPLGLSRPTEYLQVRPPLLPHPLAQPPADGPMLLRSSTVSRCILADHNLCHCSCSLHMQNTRLPLSTSRSSETCLSAGPNVWSTHAHRSTSTSWTRTRQSTRPAASSASSARCRTMCPPTACSHTQRCAAALHAVTPGPGLDVCALLVRTAEQLLHCKGLVLSATFHTLVPHPMQVFGLNRFRETELIHGRWAMLATLGVVVAEATTGVAWQDAGKVELDGASYLGLSLPFTVTCGPPFLPLPPVAF